MAMILDGKETAAALKEELTLRLAKLREKHYEPKLAIILAGSSKPSAMYASFMQKVAKGYGIDAEIFRASDDVTEEELGSLVTDLSADQEITGILMMMPLPKGISAEKMIALMNPDKDVDGLTETNAGRLRERQASSPVRRALSWRFWITTRSRSMGRKPSSSDAAMSSESRSL